LTPYYNPNKTMHFVIYFVFIIKQNNKLENYTTIIVLDFYLHYFKTYFWAQTFVRLLFFSVFVLNCDRKWNIIILNKKYHKIQYILYLIISFEFL